MIGTTYSVFFSCYLISLYVRFPLPVPVAYGAPAPDAGGSSPPAPIPSTAVPSSVQPRNGFQQSHSSSPELDYDDDDDRGDEYYGKGSQPDDDMAGPSRTAVGEGSHSGSGGHGKDSAYVDRIFFEFLNKVCSDRAYYLLYTLVFPLTQHIILVVHTTMRKAIRFIRR